jgi:hypothetical protein
MLSSRATDVLNSLQLQFATLLRPLETYFVHATRLQSIDGSLRLPLLQNGACLFRGTPLLNGLVLVMNPAAVESVVTVAVHHSEVCVPVVRPLPVPVVNFHPVFRRQRQLAPCASSPLTLEQLGEPPWGLGMPSRSGRPITPVAIIPTCRRTDLHMSDHGRLGMGA